MTQKLGGLPVTERLVREQLSNSLVRTRCQASNELRLHDSVRVRCGGSKRRSRTSFAYFRSSVPTTCQNFVSSLVMLRVRNCASTWANHNCGSVGQKGGSFTLTAETWCAGGLGSTGGGGGGISSDWPDCSSASAVRSVLDLGVAMVDQQRKKINPAIGSTSRMREPSDDHVGGSPMLKFMVVSI